MANVAANVKENDSIVQRVTFRLADEIYAINVLMDDAWAELANL